MSEQGKRKVWVSTHGIRACLEHMEHGDVYAPGYQVMLRWHDRFEPIFVVGAEVPDWVPEHVRVVHV